VDDLDAVDPLNSKLHVQGGNQAARAQKLIDPQTHCNAVLAHQLPRQTPTHADISEVIHNGAKKVPARAARSGRWQDWGQNGKLGRTNCAQSLLARRGEISSTIDPHFKPCLADNFMNGVSR